MDILSAGLQKIFGDKLINFVQHIEVIVLIIDNDEYNSPLSSTIEIKKIILQ